MRTQGWNQFQLRPDEKSGSPWLDSRRVMTDGTGSSVAPTTSCCHAQARPPPPLCLPPSSFIAAKATSAAATARMTAGWAKLANDDTLVRASQFRITSGPGSILLMRATLISSD